jgi:enoyl-CoA hydratase/carnithine racemase
VAELVAMHHAAILRLLDARVPTISAINGIVAGRARTGARADYRIASERDVHRGVLPGRG